MKHNKKSKLYVAVIMLLTVANLFLIAFLLTYVQKIEVEGNVNVKASEITEVIKKDKGSFNSIYVLAKYHSVKEDKLPKSLKSMKVGLKNPWTLKITVEEKPILGYLAKDGMYTYFDEGGMVLKKTDTKSDDVPYVKGVKGADTELYHKIKGLDDKKLSALDEIAGMSRKNKKMPDEIVFNKEGTNARYGKIWVKLGEYVTKEKTAQIFPILEKLEDQEGSLHLEYFKDEKDVVTFKKGELLE